MNRIDFNDLWQERRPSRIQVLKVYANRLRYWRQNSSPFLSGDLFADKSDVTMFPPKFRGANPNLQKIREATVIFCPSNKLQSFFNDYGSQINAKVVIAGNSDYEFHQLPSHVPRSIRHLFLQNSFIDLPEFVTTLPIGIENLRWGVNGKPKYMFCERKWESRLNKILIGPFGLTHEDRYSVRDLRHAETPSFEFVFERLSPSRFAELMQNYRYVAAVRGNGVDTHRLWESFYRGSVPVIKRSAWLDGLRGLGLPWIEVDDWSISEITVAISQKRDLSFEPKSLVTLWWPYWQRKIKEYL